jgi:hypothetical protein
MKQVYCPDTAIVENKDTTISQECTIFTNDESIVTLISPKKYPAIGEAITKDVYYIKEGELIKATTTSVVSEETITTKIATDVKSDLKVIAIEVIKTK